MINLTLIPLLCLFQTEPATARNATALPILSASTVGAGASPFLSGPFSVASLLVPQTAKAIGGQGAGSRRTVIAILDSGIRNDGEFKKYDIQSFDLTGEGPRDQNGHGTKVAALALGSPDWTDPKRVRILNVKIMDKDAKTDEVTVLKGLNIAAENGAQIINLSAAVWIKNDAAELPVRKLIQWQRRYAHVLLVSSAGNYGNKPQPKDTILFPQQASDFADKIDPKKLHLDAFDDAVFVAARGKFSRANQILVELIAGLPEDSLEEKAFRFRQGILYTEMAYGF